MLKNYDRSIYTGSGSQRKWFLKYWYLEEISYVEEGAGLTVHLPYQQTRRCLSTRLEVVRVEFLRLFHRPDLYYPHFGCLVGLYGLFHDLVVFEAPKLNSLFFCICIKIDDLGLSC